MTAWARISTAGSTPVAVFRRARVPGQMSSECGVLDSPARLELLTPHVVVLSVPSWEEYRATLDDGRTGGVYARPGVIRPQAAGVSLTTAAPCDPEGVKTRTVATQLLVCSSAVRDR